jgi:hypothetical protein
MRCMPSRGCSAYSFYASSALVGVIIGVHGTLPRAYAPLVEALRRTRHRCGDTTDCSSLPDGNCTAQSWRYGRWAKTRRTAAYSQEAAGTTMRKKEAGGGSHQERFAPPAPQPKPLRPSVPRAATRVTTARPPRLRGHRGNRPGGPE